MRISEAWMDDAACRSMPVSMFYPERGSRHDEPTPDEKRAKRLCAVCPVRRECLTYALAGESKQLVIGTKVFESCPRCHGEDFECEDPEHKPHPLTPDCDLCEQRGEVAKQGDMRIKPQASGIWGGHTATERTRINIRHYPGCPVLLPKDKRPPGVKTHPSCRPLAEQVSLLEELFVTRVHQDRILLAGEEVA